MEERFWKLRGRYGQTAAIALRCEKILIEGKNKGEKGEICPSHSF